MLQMILFSYFWLASVHMMSLDIQTQRQAVNLTFADNYLPIKSAKNSFLDVQVILDPNLLVVSFPLMFVNI